MEALHQTDPPDRTILSYENTQVQGAKEVKIYLTHTKSGYSVKLRAQTILEANMWVGKLQEAANKASQMVPLPACVYVYVCISECKRVAYSVGTYGEVHESFLCTKIVEKHKF
jgi:hypothetical protein